MMVEQAMWCKHCGPDHRLRIEWRLVPKPIGSHSLAGVGVKVAATSTPFAICDTCGRQCQGKLA